MRVRDHIALSSGAAALLYPRLRAAVVVPWAASILIDADHYLWYLARHRRLNPASAVRLFNEANAPRHAATRPFHHPGAMLLVLLLSRRRNAAMLTVIGMAFHVGLDTYHRARTANAHSVALRRDHFACQVCGGQGADLAAHLWRQPRLLPSYRPEHFVTVCAACHKAAHAQGSGAIVGLGGDWESYRAKVARQTYTTAVA